ncbi:hypothetical protein TH53_00545 [Pedobacter lusitanus]|uniref:Contig4, whole genome shotgun sequence n=1 Tax=Pedobacter lusitanus TaxID=1503925 RepID=A0A0D0GNW9_9SPHI|nr:hypothetical protein [Pedobacter lusitanus]KIO78937.1 hypothetical protein TH53_00545 [Pedobacter lusitanus]
MENFNHILLFRTDIKSEEDKQALQPLLDKNKNIEQWNVDLDDEDYVLRIVSYSLKHDDIIEMVQDHGYSCCELT